MKLSGLKPEYAKKRSAFNNSAAASIVVDIGAAGRIRTHDLRLRRPSPYPAELLPQYGALMAVGVRFELTIEVLAPILT